MSWATRGYRWCIRLLPRAIRERDGDEMARAFDDQLAAVEHPRDAAWRAFRRFPLVLALEWRDALAANRVPAQRAHQRLPRAGLMDLLHRLLTQGARSLARTPAFTLSVILLLGIGVGSVSAIFAVVDHVLLRPMPYTAAERLVVIENGGHSVPVLTDLRAMRSIEAWGAASNDVANLTGFGEPLRIQAATVTDGFFPMFDARVAVGRMLGADDFRDATTAMLSYGTWIRVFGGDSTVVGRAIRINDEAITVVGVLDGSFAVPEAIVQADIDVWRPLDPRASYISDRRYWSFGVVGRLREGATLQQAKQEAEQVATDRAKAFPDVYSGRGGELVSLPVRSLHEVTTSDVRQGLTLFFAAVTLLLLVACANVTHLFLARGVARAREMAVRRALGAGTRSLLAQLLMESTLLGVAGAIVGVGVAYAGTRTFLALMPDGLPRADAIGIDARVLMFAAGVGLLTAMVFGLMPALRFARATFGDPLRAASRNATSSRAAHTLRNGIVVAEVALSVVLIAQAGWLLRSFVRVTHQELGFRTDGVVTMPISLSGIGSAAEWHTRMEVLRESVAQTPGVTDVSFGLTMPLEWAGGGRCCWGERPVFAGKDSVARPAMNHPVTDNYFALLGTRIVAGRVWTRANANAQPHPAVINEELAKLVFGTASAAIGAPFAIDKQQFVVTGVAENSRHYGADQNYGHAVYLPVNVIPYAPGRVHLAVATARSDAQLGADLRAAVWRAEPALPVPIVRALNDWSRRASAQRRFDSVLFSVFGGVALLLVAAGLAGTLFYVVSLQRRDLGIRLALGETPGGLERRILARGTGLAAAGAVIGTGGAWMAGRLLESRLFGVDARDVTTLGVAVGVLMMIALLASWVPARRAAATNPIESLRAE